MGSSVGRDCSESADVVICGAGMAGVAAAYHLRRRGVTDLLLVDERPPLSLTSAQGTEAYRNWWPAADMVAFMNRSLDLLEQLAGPARLTRPGYVFLTADEAAIEPLAREAERIAGLGAGALRRDGYERDGPADGADLVTDRARIRRRFPFLADDVKAMLHVRRAGFLDAAALGRHLLEASGARVLRDRVVGPGRLRSGSRFDAGATVLAPGPLLQRTAAAFGADLPVVCELHLKARFEGAALPADCPMIIWNDPIGPRPGGFHFRPAGGDGLLALWTYDAAPSEPVFPPVFDPAHRDVLAAGLARVAPGLAARPGVLDGGYYCKAPDNRPLIGPLAPGVWVLGGLSGYGIMGSQAAGELLATHVTGGALPAWADACAPAREFRPREAEGQL